MPLHDDESLKEVDRAGGISEREFSEFLLRACHDLRTPLRSIRAHAELLLRDLPFGPVPALEQRLGFVVDGGRKMDLLLDGLAAYSLAIQTDARVFQPVRLEVMLRSALSGLDRMLEDCGAQVSYDRLPAVQGSPDRLVQLFENLIRNSVDHRGPAAPRIHITAEARADRWLFGLRDNGPGIERDDLEAIFKPFERLDAAHPGPGLGLAVCRAIVSRHGGKIWCESEPGAGATFFFTLPL
jgi:signal transduction histidine kinase